MPFDKSVDLGRDVVTALKLVRAEQVRRPERSKLCDQLTPSYPEKNWPSEIEETGPGWAKAAWQQTSAAHSITPVIYPRYIFLKFLFGFWTYLSNLFFHFFGRSGPVQELLPSYRSPRSCIWTSHTVLENGRRQHFDPFLLTLALMAEIKLLKYPSYIGIMLYGISGCWIINIVATFKSFSALTLLVGRQ